MASMSMTTGPAAIELTKTASNKYPEHAFLLRSRDLMLFMSREELAVLHAQAGALLQIKEDAAFREPIESAVRRIDPNCLKVS